MRWVRQTLHEEVIFKLRFKNAQRLTRQEMFQLERIVELKS